MNFLVILSAYQLAILLSCHLPFITCLLLHLFNSFVLFFCLHSHCHAFLSAWFEKGHLGKGWSGIGMVHCDFYG